MQKHIRTLYCLIFVLLMDTVQVVANPGYKIINYEELNNAVSRVERIVRDGQGMMWFATSDGLYRYDGYEFKGFKSRSGDGVNMPSNRISSGMYVNSEGSIWCLIADRAFLFDTHAYCYIDVMSGYEQRKKQTFSIKKIRSLPCGTTWFFTYDGKILALEDACPVNSVRLIADNDQLDDVTVGCDARQRSWILTGKRTYLYDKGKLSVFNHVFRHVISGDGVVWLQAKDGKLFLYDEAKKQIRPWHHPLLKSAVMGYARLVSGAVALFTKEGVLLLSPDGKQLSPTGVTWLVIKMMEDKNGHLWMLAADGRLYMADKDCRQITEIMGFRARQCDIMCDKHGAVWFFTDKGESYYSHADAPAHLVKYVYGNLCEGIRNMINDGQGGYWFIHKNRACRLTFETSRYKHLPLHQPSLVRCIVKDKQGRVFVGTREDGAVTVFNASGQRIGWLGRNGCISQIYTSFGASVFSGYCAADGTLWLGTKRDGVFRLRPRSDGSYQISQYVKDGLLPHRSVSDNEIYAFAADGRGRLWIATRKGGLCCIPDMKAETPDFIYAERGLPGWRFGLETGISSLFVTSSNLLLVGTYNGLCIADVGKSLETITFKEHQREANRKESLSSSSVTDVIRTSSGRFFVSTNDGGINEILTENLLADRLDFRHYNTSTCFPVDITHSMVEYDGTLWISAPNQLVDLQLKQSDRPEINSFLLRESPHLSFCRPCQLNKGTWIFGSEDGALLIDLDQLKNSTFVPPLVITGISKENAPLEYSVGWGDTVTLAPAERNLTIWFSALDYEDTELISYAYRMEGNGSPWTYLGRSRSVTLAQMRPGTYRIAICSTNSDGMWCNNQKVITVVVEPTFWETPWALLLVVLITATAVAITVYTLLYIRRIKRQQREIMEAYLALLSRNERQETNSREQPPVTVSPVSSPDDEELMKRIMIFIENNLGNSDASVDDMAVAVAVSRAGLHRKVKGLLGTSPMEFMREARIRKACHILSHTSKSISEVAYECGFSDPKYFSKCFKAATGQTPTDFAGVSYKNSREVHQK